VIGSFCAKLLYRRKERQTDRRTNAGYNVKHKLFGRGNRSAVHGPPVIEIREIQHKTTKSTKAFVHFVVLCWNFGFRFLIMWILRNSWITTISRTRGKLQFSPGRERCRSGSLGHPCRNY